MGYFGYGILENDNSLDAESDLQEWAQGRNPDRTRDEPLDRQEMEAALSELLPQWAGLVIDRDDPRERRNKATPLGTMAVLAMEVGARMTPEQRSQLTTGVLDIFEYDCVEPTMPALLERLAKADFTEAEVATVLKLRTNKGCIQVHKAASTLAAALQSYHLEGGQPVPYTVSAPSLG